MDPFIKSVVKCVSFSFLLNVACAFDDEFEKRWQQIHQEHVAHMEHLKGTSLGIPIEVTIGFSVMVVLMLTCFFIACFCHRRHPEMFRGRPQALLVPVQPPVMSGASTQPTVGVFTPFLGASPTAAPPVYTVVSGANPAPVMYPQQTYLASTTALPPQGSAYGSINIEPPVQPSATLLPSQPAPRSRHTQTKDISTVPLCQDW
uniref:Uncharacterized protein n=1 Tax=Rhipicephalus zambeziensis TaxID=60191 RepID=A0A224YFF1_9ACAR